MPTSLLSTLTLAESVEKQFDPKQDRDEKGHWTPYGAHNASKRADHLSKSSRGPGNTKEIHMKAATAHREAANAHMSAAYRVGEETKEGRRHIDLAEKHQYQSNRHHKLWARAKS
jgi:hypothetical protein